MFSDLDQIKSVFSNFLFTLTRFTVNREWAKNDNFLVSIWGQIVLHFVKCKNAKYPYRVRVKKQMRVWTLRYVSKWKDQATTKLACSLICVGFGGSPMSHILPLSSCNGPITVKYHSNYSEMYQAADSSSSLCIYKSSSSSKGKERANDRN